MDSNIGSWAQNMISTIYIVATWISNISSKFQLDLTTDEARSVIWWNLGNEMCFSFLFSLISIFLFSPISFCFCLCFFIVTDLGPKNMGPIPSHTREPNTNSIIHDTPIWMIIRIYLVKTLLRNPMRKTLLSIVSHPFQAHRHPDFSIWEASLLIYICCWLH